MDDDLMALTADIVAAHVSNNRVGVGDIAGLIASVHGSLASLGATAAEPVEEAQKPAVSIRASIKPDYLVCLEDGKKVTMLKRHLMSRYGLTPQAYRAKWNLPEDYPMAAPNYSARRRELAKTSGLGRKPGTKVAKKTGAPRPPRS